VLGWKARIPVPPTITRWSVPVEVGEGFPVEVEVGGVDVGTGGVETDELPPMAFALKESNLVPGFTAKTIPC
jgi:hypothetical protein